MYRNEVFLRLHLSVLTHWNAYTSVPFRPHVAFFYWMMPLFCSGQPSLLRLVVLAVIAALQAVVPATE